MTRSFIRSLSVLAALSVLLSTFFVPTAGALEIKPIEIDTVDLTTPNSTVKMTDGNLQSRIAETIGKKAGDTFTYKEITDYCKARGSFDLGATGRSITSLAGIEALAGCSNISLYLDNNRLDGLAPLAKLTHLKKLYISGNLLTDISPLAGLKELEELDVHSNQLSSLHGIEQSTGLKYVNMNNTGIADLGPLSGLINLIVLSADDNAITNLGSLQGLNELSQVSLTGNTVSDLRPLAGKQRLQYISVRRTLVTDLSVLTNLPALNTLDISRNTISSIAPLSAFTQLTNLNASSNAITNIDALRGLLKLVTLDISSNQVSNLAPLAELKSLFKLNVAKNKVADLTPFSALIKLDTLDISSNRVQSIKTLSKLSSLTKLNASDNWIIDIEPLKYMISKLTYVGLERNAIDLQAFANKNVIDTLVAYKAEVHVEEQNVNKGTPPTDTANPNPSNPFNDISNHWAKDDILWAYSNGIVGGVAPGIFNPNALTTEAQFLKMLLIAMKGTTEQPVGSPWSQKYYDLAAVNNYPVHPDQRDKPITRTTVAELIAATQGVNASGDAAIQYLLDNKLTQGKTSATVEGYKGSDNLTRAESVRFIRNVLLNAKYSTPQKRP